MSLGAEANDATLWARTSAGDADAFTALYDRYADRVHSYCFRSTGSWSTAQDLAAAVWLETWRKRRRVTVGPDESMAPWLFGVAHNVLRNSARTQRRHRAALDRLANPLHEPDHSDAVAARVDDERRMATVLAAISRLPPREQTVLTLVAWAELSQAEVAIALGISVGTVKSRLFRAREQLAKDDRTKPAVASNFSQPTTTPRSTT